MCFLNLRRGRPSKVFLPDRGGKKNRYVSDYQANSANTMGCPCVGSIAKNVAWMEPGGEKRLPQRCRVGCMGHRWFGNRGCPAQSRDRNPGMPRCPGDPGLRYAGIDKPTRVFPINRLWSGAGLFASGSLRYIQATGWRTGGGSLVITNMFGMTSGTDVTHEPLFSNQRKTG